MAQSGIVSIRTYAKLTRVTISHVPETPTLPNVVELPSTGDASVVTIGRHRSNDVQLDCSIVPSLLSRRHATIEFDEGTGAHALKDNNSLNGTYVNGILIPDGPLLLNQGDIIGFGGPTNVLRNGVSLRNSLCFVYTPDTARVVAPDPEHRVIARSRARELARAVSSVSRHRVITRSRAREAVTDVTPQPAVSRLVWKAVSRSADTPTPCHRCRIVIPPKFFRMKRTETFSGVDTDRYFHANYGCLRYFCEEIRDASDVDDLLELSEQEKRIANSLRDEIKRIRDH
jgi:pSer/pThr/pTyr-binding forkhead associated (FHA) protein